MGLFLVFVLSVCHGSELQGPLHQSATDVTMQMGHGGRRLSSACPDNWGRIGGRCYAAPPCDKHIETWAHAEEVCAEMGGHLMSGPRENMAQAVTKLHPGIPDTDFEYVFWTGLREEGEGWSWSSGENVTQVIWADEGDEQDKFPGDDAHCAGSLAAGYLFAAPCEGNYKSCYTSRKRQPKDWKPTCPASSVEVKMRYLCSVMAQLDNCATACPDVSDEGWSSTWPCEQEQEPYQCFGAGSDTCRSGSTGESCYAKGGTMDPCVCRDGLVVQARSYSEFTFFGTFVFECCGGDAPLRDCELPERHRRHAQVFRTLAVLFLVCGILGTMLTTCCLNARRRHLPLTHGDAELLVPKQQGDGWALHQAVALERWCVSLQDLQQFRRLVMHAVSGGVIQPNERDMFDVRDFHVGPSVYTVNEHFIKPVTAAAGKMSWGLLKNSAGLPCDVFVTHCWAEGIYEFIDRVESSWPSGARGAYVCFLSNPQNLDIGSLIARPSESPFALALRSSSMVLVLPNSKVSIYTRLWCVYEAFLAYSWGKTIKTAKLNLGFRLHLLRMTCLYFASTGAAWLLLLEGALSLRGLLTLCAIFGSMGCILYLCVGRQLLRFRVCFPVTQACNAVLCISVSWIFSALLFLNEEGTLASTCVFLMLLFWGLVLSCAAETDWLLFRDAEISSRHLRKDFSGRILDAGCSSSSDKDNIHREVLQSGKMHEVEEAVRVLLHMNVVTNELQRTAALVGKLGDASKFSRVWISVGICAWMCVPLLALRDTLEIQSLAVGMALQAGLWLLGFMISPAGRKKFAAVSLQLWLVALLMLMVLPLFGLSADQTIFWYDIFGGLLLGPFLLVILFAGPYRVAQVPFLGPALVRFFLGGESCRCQGRGSQAPPRLPEGLSPEDCASEATPPHREGSQVSPRLPEELYPDVTVEPTQLSV